MNDFEKAVKERTDEESMKEKTKKLCCANCKLRIRLRQAGMSEPVMMSDLTAVLSACGKFTTS